MIEDDGGIHFIKSYDLKPDNDRDMSGEADIGRGELTERLYYLDNKEENRSNAEEDGIGEDEDEDEVQDEDEMTMVNLPASPLDRGAFCLLSTRQTFAALWWFVQPLLFALIGAEIDVTKIKGGALGKLAIPLMHANLLYHNTIISFGLHSSRSEEVTDCVVLQERDV
ncbi:unnamed protein product [Protopolystoma xenopodis]|uniref:Uncharacterized protein n=1 Tax=Protopolystoma xenopodis TaxID=117903 RepID=A0A3S5AYD2_9PLAT|nr:unnamed protein product [Protopolystoma xenopodis]